MKLKQYSPAYWVKQSLRYHSQPEAEILAAVRAFQQDPSVCVVAWDGTPISLLNTLYLELKKKLRNVYHGLFPTPLDVAFNLADLARVGEHDVVFDPGAGFGNLLHVAQHRGATAFGTDFQPWLHQAGEILGLDIAQHDYLNGYTPKPFNVVLTNPPFGKVGESSDATADFLNRIADQCTPETRIAAILPSGFMQSEKPARRRDIVQRFQVCHREALPPDTFKPLTSVSTEMVLLQVHEAGPLVPKPADRTEPLLDQVKREQVAEFMAHGRSERYEAQARAIRVHEHFTASKPVQTSPPQKAKQQVLLADDLWASL